MSFNAHFNSERQFAALRRIGGAHAGPLQQRHVQGVEGPGAVGVEWVVGAAMAAAVAAAVGAAPPTALTGLWVGRRQGRRGGDQRRGARPQQQGAPQPPRRVPSAQTHHWAIHCRSPVHCPENNPLIFKALGGLRERRGMPARALRGASYAPDAARREAARETARETREAGFPDAALARVAPRSKGGVAADASTSEYSAVRRRFCGVA
jgi:hypothetical protein